MMGLPYGEEITIVGRTMWTQSTSVTDGQTDRIAITKTVQRIASHGNKKPAAIILLRDRATRKPQACQKLLKFNVSPLTIYEKCDVKQSNDLEISPMSSTIVSPVSCRVISY